jgi:hypothetical protein
MARRPLSRPWNDDELARLRQFCEADVPPRKVARLLRRSLNSVVTKAYKLRTRPKQEARAIGAARAPRSGARQGPRNADKSVELSEWRLAAKP